MIETVVSITPKQKQIIYLLLEGLKDKQIAYRFGTSPQTVKNQIRDMIERTGAETRIQAIAMTIKNGEVIL